MKEVKRKVLVTGGGTGGHIYPGLAVIEALKSASVLYVGSRRGLEKKLTQAYSIPFYQIHSRPLMGQGIFGKILSLFSIGTGFFQSLWILLKFRPQVVLATGGYVCSPVLLAAVLLRIPSLLLEQNLLPGRTTRFFSRLVSKVLVSFPESKSYLPQAHLVVTGNPVRKEIGSLTKEEGCRRLGIGSGFPVVTVMGASQGARALNRSLLGALPQLQEKPWTILHLTGETHYAAVVQEIERMKLSGKLQYIPFSFIEEMAAVYAASDFIISRAGATGLAELMQSGKGSILVPYPYAADNHQESNARWLEQKGGCRVVLEKDFTPQALVRALEEVFAHPEILRSLAKHAKEAAPRDPLEKILEVIEEAAA